MSQKTDKRQRICRKTPKVDTCRGGIKMEFTGSNSRGKSAAVTVYVDDAYVVDLIRGISHAISAKQDRANWLRDAMKEAANG